MALMTYASNPGGGAPVALGAVQPPQYGASDIRRHVAALEASGLSGDALYKQMHRDAQRTGVTMSQIDEAMGFRPGEAQAWVDARRPAQDLTRVTSNPSPPPTGLIGSEQALSGGMQSALNLIGAGTGVARQDLTGALGGAQQQLGDFASQAIGYADRGLADVERAAGDVGGIISQAVSGFQPYQTMGLQAQSRLADLLGVSGPNAQRAAIQQFEASPGQEWLQQQGEQAILRNQAALGGLGGGNVMRELQRQGQGLASQQFNTRLAQLAQMGGQGLQAAGQVGSLRGAEAGMMSDLGRARGQLGLQTGQSIADFGLASTGRGLDIGRLLSGVAMQGGMGGANVVSQFAPAIASGRTLAGQNLADIARGEVASIADQLGVTSGNLAGILSGTGGQQATVMQNYAQLLANLATQQSGQVSGLPQVQYTAPNTMGQIAQLAGGIGTMLSGWPGGENAGTVPVNTQPVAMVGTGQQFAGYA